MTTRHFQHVLGLIPARGGSKGIPHKNLRLLASRPLIDYTFAAAQSSRRLTRTILTTDSNQLADLGRIAGIEVPFLRPAEFATDAAPTAWAVDHALRWLQDSEHYEPDIIVLLQPTAPFRRAADVDACVGMLVESGADAVVSVTPVPGHYHPRWQFAVEGDELRIFTGEPLRNIVRRRQDLDQTYTRNGAVYAFRRETFAATGSFFGERCLAYVMPAEASINIDSMADWLLAEAILRGERL